MGSSSLRYIPSALLTIALLGSIYFVYSFISPGIFTSQTILLLLSGTCLIFMALIISLPSAESWFVDKLSENTVLYWGAILVVLIAALILFQQGIASGGVDYTNYMAQNA
jgi:hypothetical protein